MGKHAGQKSLLVIVGGIVWTVLVFFAGTISSSLVPKYLPGLVAPIEEANPQFSALNVTQKGGPFPFCSSGVAAVMDLSDPTPLLTLGRDTSPIVLVNTGAGIPWKTASFSLMLGANRPTDSIVIQDITVVVDQYTQNQPKSLVYGMESGCGGPYVRDFEVKLHGGKGLVEDHGVSQGVGEKPATIPTSPVGVFAVSQSEPAEIQITSNADDGLYKFHLDIKYLVNGAAFHRTVNPDGGAGQVVGGAEVPKTVLRQQGNGTFR